MSEAISNVSILHKQIIDAAATDLATKTANSQRLQKMQQQVQPEGLEAYIKEMALARAEEVAANRVLQKLIEAA